MTAAEVAERLHARPAGTGRWQARCPAHDDRSPSLSIAEGRAGRALLRCWAGCGTEAVLAAAGLAWADVCGTPTTPADRARTRRERDARDAAESAAQQHRRVVAAAADAAMAHAGAIAARLTLLPPGPEADALAYGYHGALAAAHEMGAA